jgi:hypothetical protein
MPWVRGCGGGEEGIRQGLPPEVAPVELLGEIRRMIEDVRTGVATAVNAGLTMLYWRIGNRVGGEIPKGKRAAYGKQIVATLLRQLSWSHFVLLLPLDDALRAGPWWRTKSDKAGTEPTGLVFHTGGLT